MKNVQRFSGLRWSFLTSSCSVPSVVLPRLPVNSLSPSTRGRLRAASDNVTTIASHVAAMAATANSIPEYMHRVYTWAYMDAKNAVYLDKNIVVDAILFQNFRRLERQLVKEMRPGTRVLQCGATYGLLSPRLAQFLGPDGAIDVIDVVPMQVQRTLDKFRTANSPGRWSAVLGDVTLLSDVLPNPYDLTFSFMLLHEVPDDYKRKAVAQILASVAHPGGKAVFIDYHRPHWLNPLRLLMPVVFTWLEPFALSMYKNEIQSFAPEVQGAHFKWTKEIYFGGQYQKVVATYTGP